MSILKQPFSVLSLASPVRTISASAVDFGKSYQLVPLKFLCGAVTILTEPGDWLNGGGLFHGVL